MTRKTRYGLFTKEGTLYIQSNGKPIICESGAEALDLQVGLEVYLGLTLIVQPIR